MSNSKPSKRKDVVDIIKDIKKEQRRNNGLGRQSFSKIASADFGSNTSSSSGGSSTTSVGVIDLSSRLKTSGDTMTGPIAFSTKTKTLAAGVIDISKTTGTGYSSYVIASCAAGVNDLNTITGAEHNGQLLYLESPPTVTIRLKHNVSNIFIADAADYDIVPSSFAVLIFDYTRGISGMWVLVSSFSRTSSGSSLLSSTNIWTGTTNTFNNNVVLGSSSGDNLTINAKMQSDIDLNTFDVKNVDRLKFSTTIGSGSALTSTDTGIETLFNASLPFGMLLQIPSTNSAVYSIKRGITEIINIGPIGTVIAGNTFIGSSTSDSAKIFGRISSGSANQIGIYVTNSTATIGTEGTLQIPYYTGTTPDSDATLNTKFGSVNGAMGVWYDTDTVSNSRIYVRINSSWYHAFLTKSN